MAALVKYYDAKKVEDQQTEVPKVSIKLKLGIFFFWGGGWSQGLK